LQRVISIWLYYTRVNFAVHIAVHMARPRGKQRCSLLLRPDEVRIFRHTGKGRYPVQALIRLLDPGFAVLSAKPGLGPRSTSIDRLDNGVCVLPLPHPELQLTRSSVRQEASVSLLHRGLKVLVFHPESAKATTQEISCQQDLLAGGWSQRRGALRGAWAGARLEVPRL